MLAPQKRELAAKRLKHGHKPGKKDSKVKPKGKGDNRDVIRNLKAVNRQVAQLAKQMSKAGVTGDDKTADSTNLVASTDKYNNGKGGGGSNRNNPALTRQKKVQINDPKK